MTSGVVLNNSTSKQSHMFSKQQRFPQIKAATINVSPLHYSPKSDFDKMVGKTSN